VTGQGSVAEQGHPAAAPLAHVHLRDGLEVEVRGVPDAVEHPLGLPPGTGEDVDEQLALLLAGKVLGARRCVAEGQRCPSRADVVGPQCDDAPAGSVEPPPPLVVGVDPVDRQPRHLQPQGGDRGRRPEDERPRRRVQPVGGHDDIDLTLGAALQGHPHMTSFVAHADDAVVEDVVGPVSRPRDQQVCQVLTQDLYLRRRASAL
jgi:hypothetical protein